MESANRRRGSSSHDALYYSDSSDDSSNTFNNNLYMRFSPFFNDHCPFKSIFGEVLGCMFAYISLSTTSLLPLCFISVVAFVEFFLVTTFQNASDATYVFLHVFSCATCLLMSSYNLEFFVSLANLKPIRTKVNGLRCLKLTNAILSYNWDNVAKIDVERFQTTLQKQLKQSLPTYHDPLLNIMQSEASPTAKAEWNLAFGLSMLLIGVMFIPVRISSISGVFFSSHNPLRYLELPLFVCLFNFLNKTLLYQCTSKVSAPERDSNRLWFLFLFKLGFFSVPILVLSVYSSCFSIDFGFYIPILLFFTFFFDVFPFIWYSLRSFEERSFEKPLFDLPLSQANVFYYYVLSFTGQFYVPTFGLVSLPVVYLYGRSLSYSLRKCTRLPSVTYNLDQNCFLTCGLISSFYLFIFFFSSLVVKFSCGTFEDKRLMNVSMFTSPMFLVLCILFWACCSLIFLNRNIYSTLKRLVKFQDRSTSLLYQLSKNNCCNLLGV
ncbi:hypothetical protein GEMRC1_006661 [Eukaryota sp. GEM-RC1]